MFPLRYGVLEIMSTVYLHYVRFVSYHVDDFEQICPSI